MGEEYTYDLYKAFKNAHLSSKPFIRPFLFNEYISLRII